MQLTSQAKGSAENSEVVFIWRENQILQTSVQQLGRNAATLTYEAEVLFSHPSSWTRCFQ